MKTHLMMLAAGLALTPSLAMAAPDFSGTWVRDNAQTSQESYPLYWLARTTPAPAFRPNQELVVQIQQANGTLTVTNPTEPQRRYMLDGRPHSVRTDTGVQKADVTASLGANALTIATVQPYGGMPGNVSATITETWQLSPDGKVLTVSTVRASPAKQETIKEVYTRR
ncbi:hypothetical protein [Sphingomonas quercus]|uniref:Lipocalin-like domain-containing protein n=1 Tax=Sphingomonas quercus TaxID=2842451 RepID=A0ABS6BN36_9SPHN|nr:hypothetical protein [Sphingomonas quercus]MBU3079057.1 hypothetical protein [Sphingomonas quercus]